jgi:PAS domain S-box-containing protein
VAPARPPGLGPTGDAHFKEIFDVTANEVSIEDLLKRMHPEDSERFWANSQTARNPVDPAPYVHQEYRVRRHGTVGWIEANALAYFEGTGSERRAVNLGGTVKDVTERKEREEKEHLLMREVNHRAKNMLSVVDSIAHQTAARNPEDFVERFSERIQALSAIRTCSSVTNGRGSISRTSYAPSSRISPISSVLVSWSAAPSCA